MKKASISKQMLKIQKGTELQVFISDDIGEEGAYSFHSYRQAMRAIAGIAGRNQRFHATIPSRAPEEKIDEALFSFGSNVIAFAAERGGGKTRTMLSISKFLEEQRVDQLSKQNDEYGFLAKEDRDALKHASFYALPPVSPSVIEEKQDILYVILTRIYNYSKMLLEKQRGFQKASDSQKLFEAFHACHMGIQGITRQTGDISDDFLEIQHLEDGLTLCRHFHNLVQLIVDFLGNNNTYLVLQIDDADSQIKNGFEVLENVRKYLQIPNLIIFISADMELMHDVIRQDFHRQFPDRRNDEEFEKRIARMCRKYIDKLIPPSHMITLPNLGQTIEQGAQMLRLSYRDAKGDKVLPWAEAENMDLENTLLMLIYRKTGIVFVSPTAYTHYIVPTTMRGLNQLLQLLSQMEDVPNLNSDWLYYADPHKLVEDIQKQNAVREDNLTRFAGYFINSWIPVKVNMQKDRDFLGRLSMAASARYVPMTVEYLHEKYELQGDPLNERLYLDHLVAKLTHDKSDLDDYLLLFSIRTLFTINHHKLILRQQMKAANAFTANPHDFFLVDYDPDALYLPNAYLVSDSVQRLSLGKAKGLQIFEQYPLLIQYELQAYRQQYSDVKAQLDKEKDRQDTLEMQTAFDVEAAEERLQKAAAFVAEERKKYLVVRATLKSDTAQERLALADAAKSLAGAEVVYDSAKEELTKQTTNKAQAVQELSEVRSNLDSLRKSMLHLEEAIANSKEELKVAQGLLRVCDSVEDEKRPANDVYPVFTMREYLYKKWNDPDQYERLLQTIQQKKTAVQEHPYTIPHKKYKKEDTKIPAFGENEHHLIHKGKVLYNCLVSKNQTGQKSVNFLSILTVLLRLGADDFAGGLQANKSDRGLFQMRLHYAQQCALTIAANWDVQDQLRKKMQIEKGEKAVRKEDKFRQIYGAVDEVLQKINNGAIYRFYEKICPAPSQDEKAYWSIANGFDIFEAEGAYPLLSGIARMKTFFEIFDLEWEDSGASNVPPSGEEPKVDTERLGFNT